MRTRPAHPPQPRGMPLSPVCSGVRFLLRPAVPAAYRLRGALSGRACRASLAHLPERARPGSLAAPLPAGKCGKSTLALPCPFCSHCWDSPAAAFFAKRLFPVLRTKRDSLPLDAGFLWPPKAFSCRAPGGCFSLYNKAPGMVFRLPGRLSHGGYTLPLMPLLPCSQC